MRFCLTPLYFKYTEVVRNDQSVPPPPHEEPQQENPHPPSHLLSRSPLFSTARGSSVASPPKPPLASAGRSDVCPQCVLVAAALGSWLGAQCSMNHHPLADAVPSGIAGGGRATKTHCELWAEALGEEEDSISAGPRCFSPLSPVT